MPSNFTNANMNSTSPSDKIWTEIEQSVRDKQSLESLQHDGKVPKESTAAFLQSEVDHVRSHSGNAAEALKNIKNDTRMLESIESSHNDGKVRKGGEAAQVQSLVNGAKQRVKEGLDEEGPAAAVVVEETVSTTVNGKTVSDTVRATTII